MSRLTATLGLFCMLTSSGVSAPPNVILIMTDDQGHWALNADGTDDCQELVTPNLRRLTKEGTRFTHAFVATPVCSASRATWLTGRMPSQHGVQDWLLPAETHGEDARSFIEGQPTLSEGLSRQGYRVGLCGKWHLGDDARPQVGFSDWYTVPGGGGTYRDPEFVKNGVRIRCSGFKTDLVADDAIDFIRRNRDRPFFLFLSFYAPHTPLRYQPDQYREPYQNSRFLCFPDLPVHPFHMREMNGRVSGHLRDFSKRHSKLSYSALVTGIDHNVGRVVSLLDELELREKTVIIFTSDHGFHGGHEGIWGKGNGTVPFNLYERSVRVPMIWSQPGHIPEGIRVAPFVSSYDFLPTLFDYLQLQSPDDDERVGRSYTHLLNGEDAAWKDEVFFEYEYVRGIRTRRWKYVQRTDQWPSELFDLVSDPAERHNVLSDPRNREEAASLQERLDTFFEEAGAPSIEDWRQTAKHRLATYE